MATFLLTEAEVEEHRERTKPNKVRMRIDNASDDDGEGGDKPTDYDNEFINDGDPDEDVNPNVSSKLEEMEKELAEKEPKKRRGRPPTKDTGNETRVYISKT